MVEAPDSHGMVPKTTPNIHNVCENICMLWMVRWIHHHATSTIFVCPKHHELANFLGHSMATNNVRVHWLRPQTHIEWFPHPLQTYIRCDRTFVCWGWSDGSTIMPPPPHLPAPNTMSWPNSWVTVWLQMNVHWLRPQTHVEWLPPTSTPGV